MMRRPGRVLLYTVIGAAVIGVPAIPIALAQDETTDPVRNGPVLCDPLIGPPGLPGRSQRNIEHLANRCGIVGTDIEFQTRWHRHADASSHRHDYAFVGTMGQGFQAWDITNPLNPVDAGGYLDSGWQNDIQIRGNIAVSTFDGLTNEDSTASTCLKDPSNRAPGYPANGGQGVDIIYTNWSVTTGKYTPRLIDCVGNPPGGAHNATIHPSGKWLAVSNCCSDWAIDVIDLRGVWSGNAVHRFRLIDASRQSTALTNRPPMAPATDPAERCNPTTPSHPGEKATFRCIVMKRPDGSSVSGLWDPHDVHFSADGNTMYVAAIESTWIVNVKPINDYMRGAVAFANVSAPSIAIIPNSPTAVQISHQADISVDGKVLVISDEKGGGIDNTSCNESSNGIVGGLHFYALQPITGVAASTGASPSTPKLLGSYYNPNPGVLGVETLPIKLERGCTVHVFRLGGNGSMSPGSPAFEGMSRLPNYQLMTAWYGAGIWWIDFSRAARDDDGVPEYKCGANAPANCRSTTWGNTLGWHVQTAADTWSAKEYRGHIYTGDMVRGMDVFRCTNGCPQVFRDPLVTLTKVGPATAKRGATIEYTLEYRNGGPFAAGNSKVTDTLPAQLRFVSASNGGTYNSATRQVTWNLGTVAVGYGGTVKLRAAVSTSAAIGSTIVNSATFTGTQVTSPPAKAATTVVP